MKAYRFLLLLCLLLSLTATAAAQEYVSIAELHAQAESIGGRWKKTYDTPNGTLEIDAPIIVPHTDAAPVFMVERAKPLSQAQYDEITSAELHDETEFLLPITDADGNSFTREFFLGWDENDTTPPSYEAVNHLWIHQTAPGKDYDGTAEPKTYHYPWELDHDALLVRGSDQTIQSIMDNWQALLDTYYPEDKIILSPKRITLNGSLLSSQKAEGKSAQRSGYYHIIAEQLLHDIPLVDALAFLGINYTSTQETNAASRRLSPYKHGAAVVTYAEDTINSSSDASWRVMCSFVRETAQLHDDVPLASLDQVIASIEEEIKAGNIHHIFSLRLGYVLYSEPEMTDCAVAVPCWVLDCDYFTKSGRRSVENFRKIYDSGTSIWNRWEFAQLPINAQSGNMIIFTTGDEETFSVPELVTWDEI